jgi:hypothetical protein
MIITGGVPYKFLAKYLFGSAKFMSRDFGVSASTVKETMIRKLGFKRYT